jgi:excinuclease ABC subunit A
VFTAIRDLFAMLPESRERGYKPGRFSFNVAGGRCEACQGDGQKRIEMNFLPDVYVLCDVCNGRRFNQETLAVKFNGYSIADILDLAIEDALPVLKDIPQVRQKLQTLVDVGLGYVHLGQAATTLSGGEAQRMKLARELSKRQTGKTLYVLDEPTTGLHFDDVRKLLEVLHRLTDLGNTVIIIEHNLDVIRNGDWIIDLGPEGGEEGGAIVAEGTPAQVAQSVGSYTAGFLRRYFPAGESATVGAESIEASGSSNGQPKKSTRRRSATVQ